MGTIDDIQIRKRKGKMVLQEDYEAEKAKNNKMFLELSEKIDELVTKNRELDPIVYKNSATLSKMGLTVDNQETEIFKLNRDLKEARAQVNNTEQRLLNEIYARTSDNVWEAKLSSFEMKNVIPRFENLLGEINKNQRENNRHFAELQPKFNKVNEQITLLLS